MLLNGLRIRRNHSTRAIEIQSINHNIFTSRIPNYTCHVGDTVIELNGRNITLMSLAEVNGILRQEVIYQINTISNSTPNNEQIQQSHIERVTFPEVDTMLRSQHLQSIRSERGIPIPQAFGPEANDTRTEIPVLNRSYNQLLQGQ